MSAAGYDFAQLYAEHPVPALAEVNNMTCPQALEWYHRNGYNVQPVKVKADGARMLARAYGYQFHTLARPTDAEIAWLVTNWNPAWQLGMIMGKASGLWAVDADNMGQWARFAQEHGPKLTRTAVQDTGREKGGLHLVYQRPDGELDGDPAMHQAAWSDQYPNIEVKTNGFIVVAPSVHHKTGRRYQWRSADGGEPAEPAPDLLRARRLTVREVMREALVSDERERRAVRREVDAEEEALARGDRRDLSWTDLTALPKPVWVLDGLLTVGWHGLAGPPEAGKSLLVRDWLCNVAASGRTALYVFSEGQFDMAKRFAAHPLISQAAPCLRFLESAFSLASPADVAWFCDTYRDRRPALIVLDMVYGCGLPDDNGVRDVAPVINAGKRVAAELGAAVLAVGHPGLSGERRFRGSSMWRGSFDSEWHMGDGLLTAEKHKFADRRRLHWAYTVEWPQVRLLGEGEVFSREYQRLAAIGADFAQYPAGTDADRARRLAQQLGVSPDYARRLIRAYRKSL